MNKTKFDIDWSLVGIIVVIILPVVILFLITVWQLQMFEEEAQNKNTEARCKTVGGEMGYSKCFKNGKEI
nr:MAG TPA: chitin synthase regulator [Caudoviricetes sp.]